MSGTTGMPGNSPEFLFAKNLAHQEARRWAEYLERGTRKALYEWRAVRRQLALVRDAA